MLNNNELNKSEKIKLFEIIRKEKREQGENEKRLFMNAKKENEIEKKKKLKSLKIVEESYDSDSDHSEIINEMEIDQVSKKSDNIIVIKSENYTEPEFYNDYMVEFKKPIKKISKINIIDCAFPEFNTKVTIDDESNQFIFVIGDEEKDIGLADGDYDMIEVLESIQDAIYDENDITLSITETDHVCIENKKNEIFEIYNTHGVSITRKMGFTKNFYRGKTKYTSDEPVSNNKELYLFINNISPIDAIAKFNLNNNECIPMKNSFDVPIKELDTMIIQFKTSDEEYSDLIDFNNKSHNLTLEIEP
jgi:hypothetical protein